MKTREVSAVCKYNGQSLSKELSGTLLELSFTDNASGSADELEITIADVDDLWLTGASPVKGDAISACLKLEE